MGLETVHTMKYVRLMCNFQLHIVLYMCSYMYSQSWAFVSVFATTRQR